MANKWEATLTPKNARREVLRGLRDLQRNVLDVGVLIDFGGPIVQSHIVTRTQDGLDMHDRTMRSYDEGYAKRKKGGRTRPRTLTDRGDMMGAVTFRKRSKKRGRVFVLRRGSPSSEFLARIHHDDVEWFGLSPKGLRDLNRRSVRFIERRMRRTLGKPRSLLRLRGRGFRGGNVWRIRNQ